MNKSTKISNNLPLFDSNILVFGHNVASPFHERAKKLIFSVTNQELQAVLSPQNLLEFYSIITNPKRVEKPLSVSNAQFVVREYLTSGVFVLVYPGETTFTKTFELARRYKISKSEIFDTFLVATMLDNEIDIIYTDNEKHFKIFREIKVVNPFNKSDLFQ